mgnify:CR=1 FL=1
MMLITILLTTCAQSAEKVDVEQIKEKYWARGSAPEMGVVQNRTYSKALRIESSIFAGISTTDPFLSVRTAGGSIGFHFSEYLAFHVVAFKSFVSPSTALKTFEDTIAATTNYNSPKWFVGAEGSASLLYGKLSLLGQKILYYDMHLTGGAGLTSTRNGDYFTPTLGLGQQVYLSQNISLRLDYRVMAYREDIVERVITSKLGQVTDRRYNFTHSVIFGLTFLLPSFAKVPPPGGAQ